MTYDHNDDIEIIYWGDDETDDIVNSNRFNDKKRKKPEKIDVKKEIFSFIRLVLLAVVIALVINNFIIINATVPTGSMEHTIHKNS